MYRLISFALLALLLTGCSKDDIFLRDSWAPPDRFYSTNYSRDQYLLANEEGRIQDLGNFLVERHYSCFHYNTNKSLDIEVASVVKQKIQEKGADGTAHIKSNLNTPWWAWILPNPPLGLFNFLSACYYVDIRGWLFKIKDATP